MISWVSFEWKTSGLPVQPVACDPFHVRTAAKSESDAVGRMIKSAFTMDSVWGDVSRPLAQKMEMDLESAFEHSEPSCIVLVHGTRIIGASLLDLTPEVPSHLASGPCILHEYRNRGLASALLAASLAFLKDHQIAQVRGITRANSMTARFIYPKFGGIAQPFEGDPFKPATSELADGR